jgi:hypothetical protein
MITIVIQVVENALEKGKDVLSDLVKKHLYGNHRDCGMQAVARLFTS